MPGVDLNRNQKLAFYVLLGLSIIGVAYTHVSRSSLPATDEIVIAEPGSGARVAANDSDRMPSAAMIGNSGKVICHVAGCVKCPGVYTLESGKRVVDAINAAGGPKPNADLDTINLAARVEDGSRIDVISLQDTRSALAAAAVRAAQSRAGQASSRPSSDPNGKLGTPGEGMVRINSAGLEQLQRLPGVGPATAQKILDYRSAIRRFTKPEQLMDVKGIGPKKFEKMRPFVTL